MECLLSNQVTRLKLTVVKTETTCFSSLSHEQQCQCQVSGDRQSASTLLYLMDLALTVVAIATVAMVLTAACTGADSHVLATVVAT